MSQKLTDHEIAAIVDFVAAAQSDNAKFSSSVEVKRGWFTVTEISEFSGTQQARYLRQALLNLASLGFFEQKTTASIRHFRISKKGRDLEKN